MGLMITSVAPLGSPAGDILLPSVAHVERDVNGLAVGYFFVFKSASLGHG
jgi:hypothetical protein